MNEHLESELLIKLFLTPVISDLWTPEDVECGSEDGHVLKEFIDELSFGADPD